MWHTPEWHTFPARWKTAALAPLLAIESESEKACVHKHTYMHIYIYIYTHQTHSSSITKCNSASGVVSQDFFGENLDHCTGQPCAGPRKDRHPHGEGLPCDIRQVAPLIHSHSVRQTSAGQSAARQGKLGNEQPRFRPGMESKTLKKNKTLSGHVERRGERNGRTRP